MIRLCAASYQTELACCGSGTTRDPVQNKPPQKYFSRHVRLRKSLKGARRCVCELNSNNNTPGRGGMMCASVFLFSFPARALSLPLIPRSLHLYLPLLFFFLLVSFLFLFLLFKISPCFHSCLPLFTFSLSLLVPSLFALRTHPSLPSPPSFLPPSSPFSMNLSPRFDPSHFV